MMKKSLLSSLLLGAAGVASARSVRCPLRRVMTLPLLPDASLRPAWHGHYPRAPVCGPCEPDSSPPTPPLGRHALSCDAKMSRFIAITLPRPTLLDFSPVQACAYVCDGLWHGQTRMDLIMIYGCEHVASPMATLSDLGVSTCDGMPRPCRGRTAQCRAVPRYTGVASDVPLRAGVHVSRGHGIGGWADVSRRSYHDSCASAPGAPQTCYTAFVCW